MADGVVVPTWTDDGPEDAANNILGQGTLMFDPGRQCWTLSIDPQDLVHESDLPAGH
jgi:hypothetical protein